MSHFFLSSFATRAHHDSKDLSRTSQFMPPLMAGKKTLNFDYSLLLICRSLIMDETSYNVMTSKESGMPDSVQEQIRIFKEEGFIELRDYGALSFDERNQIDTANASELAQHESWDEVLISCIDSWFPLGETYGERFGGSVAAGGKIPYVLNEYLGRRGDYDDVTKARKFWSGTKLALKKGHQSCRPALREMSEILLDYIHTGVVLANKFKARNYEWDNLQNIFVEKLRRAESMEQTDRPKGLPVRFAPASRTAKQFSTVVLPYDFPTADMKKAVSLLRDRRIEVVREVVQSLDKPGVEINEALRNDFMRAINASNHSFRKRRRLDLFTKPLRLVLAIFPAGSLVVELGHAGYEAGRTLAELGAEQVLDHQASKHGVKRKKMGEAMWVIHRNLDPEGDIL